VTTTHTHDGLGRRTRDEVAGTSRTLDDTFDAAGNRTRSRTWVWSAVSQTFEISRETTYTRNAIDQVNVEVVTGGETTKRTYDPAGNVVDACRWDAGSMVGACLQAGTTPWTDPPTHSTSSAWDAQNQRISLTDATSGTTTTYDPAHDYAPDDVYLPTGTGREHQTLYGYDGRHRLTSITHRLCVLDATTANDLHDCTSTTPTGSTTYTYDATDNRIRVQEGNGSTSTDEHYCYDARHQLTRVDSTAGCSTGSLSTGTYDDSGNRTDWTIVGALRVRTAYDGAGQLCDVESGGSPGAPLCTGGNVVHDDAGRMTEFPDGLGSSWRILAYDAEGRVTEICDAACTGTSPHADFAYDADGRRTSIDYSEGGSGYTVTFAYNGDAISAEYVDGVLAREYLTDEAGGIVQMRIPSGQANEGTYLVVWNGHGDATALWRIKGDGTLELANSITYGTWGFPSVDGDHPNTSVTGNPDYGDLGFRFLYVGRYGVQWDGRYGPPLFLMGARHYHAEFGRFLQPDPAALEENVYAYAANAPTTRIDPSGLLNQAEFDYCRWPWNGIRCIGALRLGELAWAIAKKEFPRSLHNGRGDAFRHCCWSGFMAIRYGQAFAKDIGNAHEEWAGNPAREKAMDLRNNEWGRWYATRLGWFNFNPFGTIVDLCRKGATNGQLQIRL
jgi:RHS repeat-associated protein